MENIKNYNDYIKESYSNNLTLQQLKNKYPEIKFTMDKKAFGYFVRADIKDQGGNMHYLGALKGQVSEKDGLLFLNNVANNNYDKFY